MRRLLSLRESPHPNAEEGGNDKGDPAYSHWNRMGPESDLGVIDQSQEVTKSKNGENDARDA
jgi:hypothetical protein